MFPFVSVHEGKGTALHNNWYRESFSTFSEAEFRDGEDGEVRQHRHGAWWEDEGVVGKIPIISCADLEAKLRTEVSDEKEKGYAEFSGQSKRPVGPFNYLTVGTSCYWVACRWACLWLMSGAYRTDTERCIQEWEIHKMRFQGPKYCKPIQCGKYSGEMLNRRTLIWFSRAHMHTRRTHTHTHARTHTHTHVRTHTPCPREQTFCRWCGIRPPWGKCYAVAAKGGTKPTVEQETTAGRFPGSGRATAGFLLVAFLKRVLTGFVIMRCKQKDQSICFFVRDPAWPSGKALSW